MNFIDQVGGLDVLLNILEGMIPDLKSKIISFLEGIIKDRGLDDENNHILIQIYLNGDTLCFDIGSKYGRKVTKVCNVVTIGKDLFPPVFDFFIKLQDQQVESGVLTVECLKLIRYHPDDLKKTSPKEYLIVAFTPIKDGECQKPIKTMSIEQFVKSFILSIKTAKNEKRIG